MTTENIWLTIGIVGQLAFTARFIVQWLSSESAGKSVMPVAFWYLSIVGAMILLCYATYRRDPVFIIGQSTGLFIYLRNIYFVRRERTQAQS